LNLTKQLTYSTPKKERDVIAIDYHDNMRLLVNKIGEHKTEKTLKEVLLILSSGFG